jgi:hypothetical protein
MLPPQTWDEESQRWLDSPDDQEWASCTFAAQRPTRAVSGLMMEACGRGGSSSTGRTETAASSRPTRN